MDKKISFADYVIRPYIVVSRRVRDRLLREDVAAPTAGLCRLLGGSVERPSR